MKRSSFESRELIVGSLDEIAQLPPPNAPFAVLLAAGPSSPTPNETALIEVLAVSNCREMCFAGRTAERLHDVADEVIEARGLFDIVTTWLTNETPSEVAFYYVTVAGGVPPVLLAPVDRALALASAVEAVFDGGES